MDDRIEGLARARGETISAAEAYLAKMSRSFIPSRFVEASDVTSLDVVDSGFDTLSAWVRLASGRVFFGYVSTPNEIRQYWMIRDKIPKAIKPAAFGVVRDIVIRHIGRNSPDHDHLPVRMGESVVVVEVGAYLGLKSMRYADRCGSEGRVVAIEIDENNFELLNRNISENKLENRIAPVLAGVWSVSGERQISSAHHQRHSFADTGAGGKVIACFTISDIMTRFQLDRIDYLNIQVNGAELHALEGLGSRVADVRVMDIASRYDVEGEPVRPKVEAWLIERGFDVFTYEKMPTRLIAKRL